jgi:hypothetical protein
MIATEKRRLKVTPNYKDRTFTLRFYYPDGSITKYRTIPLPKDEFESCEHNTDNDWKQFLNTDEYYEVK